MGRWSFSVVLSLGLISIAGRVFSQPSNTAPWPNDPGVGIGTQLSGGWLNSLHLHYDPSKPNAQPAMIRLSEGSSTITTNDWGLLGLMYNIPDTTYSSLARGKDLILHDQQDGDIIITNFTHRDLTHTLGGAIRFATTGDTTLLPIPPPGHHDLERLTIMPNGNIGIDLPPDTAAGDLGLGNPMDQLQIGGGSIPPPPPWYTGYTSPIPGLTIYGGNRFEGMMRPGGGIFPVDWRGIAFNHYEDHMTGIGSRVAPMAWSGIGFSDNNGGLVNIGCTPWHTGDALTEDSGGMTLQLQGNSGLYLWSDDRLIGGSQYKHLFEVWRKGYDGGLGIRNDSGLFFHHTPVYIGGMEDANFTNLANVKPNIGDDSTWMLAVNGPALFKEAFVSTDWPDFVFDPKYNLRPLDEVEQYIYEHHHLPDVPSADSMAKTGIPLGATEAKMMQKIEEQQLYIIELSKRIERLEEAEGLKNQKER